jgi:hypothetical protein
MSLSKRVGIVVGLLVCAAAPFCRCFALDSPANKIGDQPILLDAQIISDTIPARLRVNTRMEVSVTVKNTGRTAWSYADDYKLGAIDDSDPFAPGRIDLSTDESVAVGRQKVFSFIMMAPPAPGTYTSDWRMLREHVCRFGDTLIKQIEVTPMPPPPGPARSFGAAPGDRQVGLSWTNPSDSYFAGTMIRFKTTGYPTGIADGALVTNRIAVPGMSDGYVHTNLTNGVTYYYRAFSHNDVSDYNTSDSVGVSATPAYDAVWMSQTFDAYGDGNLGGQGNWTTEAADSQVQSTMAVSGKALVIDSRSASGEVANRYAGFATRASGTANVSFDVAQSYGGRSAKPFGAVVLCADNATEIARFNCATGSWRLEYGSGSVAVLSSSVTQNTWYSIRLTFDLSNRSISAYVNGARKATNLSFKTGSASNIASTSVTSSMVRGLTAQKMYLDNLRGETMPSAQTATTTGGVKH